MSLKTAPAFTSELEFGRSARAQPTNTQPDVDSRRNPWIRNALQLLTKEFGHMQQLGDKILAARPRT